MTVADLRSILQGLPDSARIVYREGAIGAARYLAGGALSIDPRGLDGQRDCDVEVVRGFKGPVVILFKEEP